jgi:hypothetical protein
LRARVSVADPPIQKTASRLEKIDNFTSTTRFGRSNKDKAKGQIEISVKSSALVIPQPDGGIDSTQGSKNSRKQFRIAGHDAFEPALRSVDC